MQINCVSEPVPFFQHAASTKVGKLSGGPAPLLLGMLGFGVGLRQAFG